VAFQPQPIRERTEPLPCPVCAPAVRLGSRSLAGLWVDECPQCLGLWAPGDVMDRLVNRVRESRRQARGAQVTEHHERRAVWQDQVVYRHCPECGGTMQRKNFGGHSGVVLDWCGSHGTWLDAHEMEDVAAFVMEGGLEQAPPGTETGMPADPARTAAILAAQELLIQEGERSQARQRGILAGRAWKGFGDLFDQILK
jgi:Zn-finger nucleic acid-binding protein